MGFHNQADGSFVTVAPHAFRRAESSCHRGIGRAARTEIGRQLCRLYDEIGQEPIPDRLQHALRRLDGWSELKA